MCGHSRSATAGCEGAELTGRRPAGGTGPAGDRRGQRLPMPMRRRPRKPGLRLKTKSSEISRHTNLLAGHYHSHRLSDEEIRYSSRRESDFIAAAHCAESCFASYSACDCRCVNSTARLACNRCRRFRRRLFRSDPSSTSQRTYYPWWSGCWPEIRVTVGR